MYSGRRGRPLARPSVGVTAPPIVRRSHSTVGIVLAQGTRLMEYGLVGGIHMLYAALWWCTILY